jgi:glycosyltransferase involved in cell wall biosynthesis
MRIFLYNKYFYTSGGGEKHAGGIAEVLSQKHEVFILHEGKVDIGVLSEKLSLDLSRVQFIQIGQQWKDMDAEVLALVEEYRPDLFINSTYLSALIVNGPLRASLIFFPRHFYTKIPSYTEKIKYQMGRVLFSEYDRTVSMQEGFSHEEFNKGTVGRWSYENSVIVLKHAFSHADIYFNDFKGRFSAEKVKSIRIDGTEVAFHKQKGRLQIKYKAPAGAKIELDFTTFRPSEVEENSQDDRDLGLFLTQVNTDALSLYSRLIVTLWQIRPFRRVLNSLYVKMHLMRDYYHYRNFLYAHLNLSNSIYTDSWIRRIYGDKGVETALLYPPVDVEKFTNSEKKLNRIISVGRFFVGGHNKKQLELIKAFKRMYDRYPEARNYELHLCGGTHKERVHQDYVRLCKLSAQGYPIKFHLDIPFTTLSGLYASARIFWHGAGMNEDESRHPDKFEHFGITTVEAIASGCVPVVIGVAGQLEIVKHKETGFLWNSEEELIGHTLSLIRNEDLANKLAEKAVQSVRIFGRDTFNKRVWEIFENMPGFAERSEQEEGVDKQPLEKEEFLER